MKTAKQAKSKQPGKPGPIKQPAPVDSLKEQDFQLIRFDNKVKSFIGIFLALYVLTVLFSLNGSSIGIWNTLLPQNGVSANKGIIYGQPRSIRSDEWLGGTPFFLAQASQGYPVENSLLGPLKTPLMWNLPNWFFTNWLRPSYWGAYFFNVERAYSFYWNFRVFSPIILSFLFFMLLTRNMFFLSSMGSLWVFLTPAVQWWSLYPGEIIAFLCLIFISLVYIFYAKSTRTIILNSLLLVLGLYNFATEFYPAFLVPFAYVLGAVMVGYFLDNVRWDLLTFRLVEKLASFVLALLVFGALLYALLNAMGETKEVMMQTVYPGKRISTGGSFTIVELFSSYWGYFLSDGHVPAKWGNICELSNFLMFFPAPIYFTFKHLVLRKKISRTLVVLTLLAIFNLVYLLIGFPESISKYTFYSYSPEGRMVLIMGFLNLMMVIVFLSQQKRFDANTSKLEIAILTAIAICFLYYVSIRTNADVENYFTSANVFSVLLFIGLAYHVLMNTKFKYSSYVFGAIVMLFLLPNLKVNPINAGLKPILQNPLAKVLLDIRTKHPEAKWAVFGHFAIPSYLKALGVPVINGLSTLPDFKQMEVIDPGLTNKTVYNRYGYMNLQAFIDGKDSVLFRNDKPDLYTVGIDPCSTRLRDLGVKFLAFTYTPAEAETRCMKLIYQGSVLIYERN